MIPQAKKSESMIMLIKSMAVSRWQLQPMVKNKVKFVINTRVEENKKQQRPIKPSFRDKESSMKGTEGSGLNMLIS